MKPTINLAMTTENVTNMSQRFYSPRNIINLMKIRKQIRKTCNVTRKDTFLQILIENCYLATNEISTIILHLSFKLVKIERQFFVSDFLEVRFEDGIFFPEIYR
jgi:hypothetical protein